jgi:hypothetical protein
MQYGRSSIYAFTHRQHDYFGYTSWVYQQRRLIMTSPGGPEMVDGPMAQKQAAQLLIDQDGESRIKSSSRIIHRHYWPDP